MALKLSEYKTEQSGVIKEVLDNQIAAKLVEFGFLPGAVFSILNKAPFNGPIFVQIENNRVALRRKEAAFIIVE